MKLIQDLGIKDFGSYKKRIGIYECPICKKHFESTTANVKNMKSTKCVQCSFSNKKTKYTTRNRKLYGVWRNMINRCTNDKCNDFKLYGERGISVCPEWYSFDNFSNDMSDSFMDGLSLDRINNDGNYNPLNCRWATKTVQSRNTRILNKNNTSGYRGVSYSNSNKGYVSNIIVSYKKHYLRTFNDPKEAAITYDTFVIVYGLEHTTNFPKGVFNGR